MAASASTSFVGNISRIFPYVRNEERNSIGSIPLAKEEISSGARSTASSLRSRAANARTAGSDSSGLSSSARRKSMIQAEVAAGSRVQTPRPASI